jgi:hypothetical protein
VVVVHDFSLLAIVLEVLALHIADNTHVDKLLVLVQQVLCLSALENHESE